MFTFEENLIIVLIYIGGFAGLLCIGAFIEEVFINGKK